MFDGAEKFIGGGQIADRARRHPSIVGKRFQHVERARAAQMRTPAAKNQLLRLDEELDLADAATPQLDVMARHLDFGMAAHGMNLPLHRMHIGDGGIVEIFAPDKRREFADERLAPAFSRPRPALP